MKVCNGLIGASTGVSVCIKQNKCGNYVRSRFSALHKLKHVIATYCTKDNFIDFADDGKEMTSIFFGSMPDYNNLINKIKENK